MSDTKSVLKDTALYGLPTIFGKFFNFLLTPLYTAIFDVESYGVVILFYAITSFLNVVLTFGMETTYFRFAAKEGSARTYNHAFFVLFLISAFYLAFSLFFNHSITNFLNFPYPEIAIYMALINVADAIGALPFAKLRYDGKALKFSGIRLFNILLNIFLNVLFLVILPKYAENHTVSTWIYNPQIGIGYIFIANLIASLLTTLWLLWKNLPSFIKIEKEFLRRLFFYTWPLLFIGLAGMTNEMLDRLMLEYLLPPSESKQAIGIYGACYKLSILITIFIQGYRFAAEPFFFKKFATEGAQKQYAHLMNIFVAIASGAALFVMLFLQFFADLFLRNPAYHEGLFIVPILLAANIFLGIYYNLSIWYKVTDKNKYGSIISIVGAVLTFIGILMFTAKYGYVAPAWTTLVVYFIMCVLCYVWGQKFYKIPYNLFKIFFYLALPWVLLYIFNATLGSIQNEIMVWTYKFLLLLVYAIIILTIEKRTQKIKV